MKFTVSLLTFLAVGALAVAQTGGANLPPNNQDTQLFRGLLHFHEIQPVLIDDVHKNYDYSNLIVVVFGDPPKQRVVDICRSTLTKGGAVLVASDSEMNLSRYFPSRGDVQITDSRVTFKESEVIDSNNPSRPLAYSTRTGPNPFTGVVRVATFGSSYLVNRVTPVGVPLVPVATFLPGANVTTSNGEPLNGVGAGPLAFALATTDDSLSVRCMVLADQDVFSNRMIYTSGREDNPTDNLKLANNTVQWLKGHGRNKCLFIFNGDAVNNFEEFKFSSVPISPPIPPVPVPNILDPELQRDIANTANKALNDLERNDAMNRGILSAARGQKSTVIAILAGMLLGVSYLIFRWRAVQNWYRRTFRPIPRDPAMLGPDVAVGSIEHRRLELLRSADYAPVLRPVVRQLFQDRGLPSEYTGDKLPPLEIDVGRPQFLREAIHSLWVVVRTSAPVGYGRWKQLEPLLAAVRAAADDDRWRFVAPSPRDAAS